MTRLAFMTLLILLTQIGTPPALEAQSPSCPKNVRQC